MSLSILRCLWRGPPLLLVVLALGLASCAPTVWHRPGGTDTALQQDGARCDYETSIATQQVDYGYRTVVGQSLDQALRKRELMRQCLVANGWSQESPQAVQYVAPRDDAEEGRRAIERYCRQMYAFDVARCLRGETPAHPVSLTR